VISCPLIVTSLTFPASTFCMKEEKAASSCSTFWALKVLKRNTIARAMSIQIARFL